MHVVSGAQQPPAPPSGLVQHPHAHRVRRAIRDAMQERMNLNARPQFAVDVLPPRPIHNLSDGEVRAVGLLAVQERGGQKDFVSDLDVGFRIAWGDWHYLYYLFIILVRAQPLTLPLPPLPKTPAPRDSATGAPDTPAGSAAALPTPPPSPHAAAPALTP